jgi:sarcosine oxidase, subunit gamma
MVKTLLDPCSMIRVQTWDSRAVVPSKVEQALGIAWPREVGATACGGADIICTGPTDWLMIATDPDGAALRQGLNETFEGSGYTAIDVSQALARIEIEGPEARALLTKGCALNLDAPRFPPGRAARTRFAGMPVTLRCTRPSAFECLVATSYRDYLVAWLTDAATEFSEAVS